MSIGTIVAGKAAGVAVKQLARLMTDMYAEHRRKRAHEAMESLAAELALCIDTSSADTIAFDADLESLDLLEEYFLNWMLLIEPAARIYVARLTAPYVAGKAARDAYFRRVGEMLRSADRHDVAELRQLFRLVDELLANAVYAGLPRGELRVEVVHAMGFGATLRNGSTLLNSVAQPGHLEKATFLLDDHRLCASGVRQANNSETVLSIDYAEKLVQLFK